MQTPIEKLILLIPDASQIKKIIFENDADEKMLDNWLWERMFKENDFKGQEKKLLNEFYEAGAWDAGCRRFDFDDFYKEKFKK